jgi:hypothetical protein
MRSNGGRDLFPDPNGDGTVAPADDLRLPSSSHPP